MRTSRELLGAVRTLSQHWRYTAPAVLALAVSIGATTALFSVLKGVVLEPLPYDEPDQLVKLNHVALNLGPGGGYVSCLDFVDIRDRIDVFESLAVYYDYREEGLELTGGERPVRLLAMPVSADYFSTLRVSPLHGRTFARHDEQEETHNVVVSYRFWQDQLDGRKDGIGSTVLLDREPHNVIGILPNSFVEPFGRTIDVFVPQNLVPENYIRTNFFLSAIGRLRRGVTMEEAQANLDAVVTTVDAGNTRRFQWRMQLVQLSEAVVGRTAGVLAILFASGGVVLLIACVSVANLTLAQAASRERDFAIRSALGAGRARLARQVVFESTLVAGLGGLAGFGIAASAIHALQTLRPEALPRLEMITMDSGVLLFTVLISMTAVFVTGLFPASKLSHRTIQRSLRSSSRTSSVGACHRRFRWVLVIVQISLAFILLIAASLLVRTFFNMSRVDPGFEANEVLTFKVDLPLAGYPLEDSTRRIDFQDQLHQRVEAIPGVTASGAVSRLPLTGEYLSWGYKIRSEEEADGEHAQRIANVRAVSGRYFEAIGVPLLRGRLFTNHDRADAQPVAIVNRSLTERRFGGRDPIGEEIEIGGWLEIVGVVGDVRTTVRGEVPERIYLAYPQVANAFAWNMVHVVAGAPDLVGTTDLIRRGISALDPKLVLHDPSTLEAVTESARARESSAMWLMVGFAVVAMVLAVVGIFGVLAYTVSQRDREIGVRIALGARGSQVRWTVIREGLLMTTIAVTIGVIASASLTGWLRSLLFEVSPTDMGTFATVSALFAVTAVCASLGPAQRAIRVDPMKVLKTE